jgi:AcrR family transcriptional regulator
MPTRTRSKPAFIGPSTRERILAAAEKLFAEDGFDRVSMPAIAKASGITAGAIYKHFESKEELFFAVVRNAVETTAMRERPSFDAAVDIPKLVAEYSTEPLKRIRQIAVEIHYASGKHPKVRRMLKRGLEANIAELGRGIAEAQRRGRLDPVSDPKLMALAVFVFILGMVQMESLAPDRIGDPVWEAFVEGRVAALLGVR